MADLKRFLLQRRWVLALAGLIGAGYHLARGAPTAHDSAALAAALAEAIGGKVDAKELSWEPQRSALAELVVGRHLLFLGKPAARGPRDVFRARVRLSPNGNPLSIHGLRNLTETASGDEAALAIKDARAVFSTLAFERIQSATILELEGIREADLPQSWLDRLLLAINSFQETGSFAGVGRTDIVLDVPADEARLTLRDEELVLDLGSRERNLVFDLDTRKLSGPEGGHAYAARAVPRVYRHKPFIFWAVDTVRAEVGPAPIAWLENKVFGARDAVKRTTYALWSGRSHRLREDALSVRPPLGADSLAEDQQPWPPPPIESLWEEPEPGEGSWRPIDYPFLKALPGTSDEAKPPAYFYRTFIRPDPARPYVKVVLIAMDMRQLELGMQAGYEDPKPTTGAPGEGQLPKDPDIIKRVVGTFNGAFKTTHGEYGMMVDERVLVPPVPGGATVLVDEFGRTGLGNWPRTKDIPSEIVSFRQNLDPLVEDGRVNPSGRYVWGWQLEGKSVLTQRSGLCVNTAGHLYYAFANEMSAPTLASALKQAGCTYALHLDMNPGHVGFVFADIVDAKKSRYNVKLADPQMEMPANRHINWSPKDFFYVMLRDPTPRAAAGVEWVPDGGTQPPPAGIPGIFSSTVALGNVEVELLSFQSGRVRWQLIPGDLEPAIVDPESEPPQISERNQQRVLAAVSLGHTTEHTRYGLAFGTEALVPLRAGYATLILDDWGMHLAMPGKRPVLRPNTAMAQLPLVARDGALTPAGRSRGAVRLRAALCTMENGRALLATGRHDSSNVLASALIDNGCRNVVELERGSHHAAFIHRSGGKMPPLQQYEPSVLYALGRPMQPSAFRWRHELASPSSKPTGVDVNREALEKQRDTRRARKTP